MMTRGRGGSRYPPKVMTSFMNSPLLLLLTIFPENFSQEGSASLQNQHIHRNDYYHVPHNQVSMSIINAIIIAILSLITIITRRGAFIFSFKTILYPYPHHHRHTRQGVLSPSVTKLSSLGEKMLSRIVPNVWEITQRILGILGDDGVSYI